MEADCFWFQYKLNIFFSESLPTSTAEHASATTQHSSLLQSAQQQQQWSPLPLEQRELDILHTATIPPYQFWHSEFRNKQPAFFR